MVENTPKDNSRNYPSPNGMSQDVLELLGQLEVLLFEVNPSSFDVTPLGSSSIEFFERLGGNSSFWARLIPEDYFQQLKNLSQSVMDEGSPLALEHPVLVEGAADPWYRTSLRRVQAPGGGFRLWMALQDVTAQRMGESYWHEVEAWLTSVGQSVPFDFWIISRQATVGFQNETSIQRLGPVQGRQLEEAVANNPTAVGWIPLMRRALAGERGREEIDESTPTAPKQYIRLAVPVIGHQDGLVMGALGIELEAPRAGAGAMPADQQRIMELGGRAAVVAHEIRHPLASLFNGISLLRKETENTPSLHGLISLMEAETHRLEQLTANILGFVRAPEPKMQPTNVATILDASLRLALRVDGGEKVEITKHYEPSLPELMADHTGLELAFENLIRNAVQAMRGKGELFLTLQNDSPRGIVVLLDDNGPGIPVELRERIFDPFVTTRRSGVGLGLTIVRYVIEVNHKGKIELAERPGGGTRWRIQLPFNN